MRVYDQVMYEWSIQPVDNTHGDIHENYFEDKLSGYYYQHKEDLRNAITKRRDESDMHLELCLIRLFGNDCEGVKDRQLAYVDQAYTVIDGEAIMIPNQWQLPSHFECGNPIPLRFHKELAAAIKRVM